MSYYVRLLSPATRPFPFSELKNEVATIRLLKGEEEDWDEIEISGPSEIPVALLERIKVEYGGAGVDLIGILKNRLTGCLPANAREWIYSYLSSVRTVYAFRLLTDNLTTSLEWQTLGLIQNQLKDKLGGIIQSDNEGYFNENGDYILWQMYAGAAGSIPAAVMVEGGEWIPFSLNLNDERAVERFKRGERPPKGFLEVLFRK